MTACEFTGPGYHNHSIIMDLVPTWSTPRTSSELYNIFLSPKCIAITKTVSVQKIVCHEVDEVFGNDMEKELDASDLAKLKYLDMCIKESLRLFPPAPMVARLATQDVQLGEQIYNAELTL